VILVQTATQTTALIGPNALIQTVHALQAIAGPAATFAVLAHADRLDLLDTLPTAMVPAHEFNTLVAAVHATLLPATANQVLEESGARTAAYVIRNRIPAPIRTLLRILPPRPAARLLLATIARHSWTFASAAAFSYQLRPTPTVRLAGDPATGAMPGVAVDPYLATAITPMMYQAQETLRIAREERPNAKRILDGVHKKFTALCEELVARNLPVHWGINTRVTDIMRDEAMLPLWRKAGLIHISLGTEAAAQMNLDRFRKQTTIEQNKRAIKLIQSHGMVAEAQFIMGMENETPETIEETYRLHPRSVQAQIYARLLESVYEDDRHQALLRHRARAYVGRPARS
jgi:bacteriochlorophyll 4-vinyl reductase